MSIQNENPGRSFRIEVDGETRVVHDNTLSAKQVLEAANQHPIEEYLVFWFDENNVLEDLNLDETVRLRTDHVERFLTFKNDRSFRFDIEGRRQDWGAACITEETLLKLAGAGAEFRVWLERTGEPDRLIDRGETVRLDGSGIEKFYLDRQLSVTVVNEDNGRDFKLQASKKTKIEKLIEEIYVKIGVPRRQDDRLRCEEGGEDVFQFASLTVGEYLDKGHCKCLVWLFAGGTGGAVCQ